METTRLLVRIRSQGCPARVVSVQASLGANGCANHVIAVLPFDALIDAAASSVRCLFRSTAIAAQGSGVRRLDAVGKDRTSNEYGWIQFI